MIYILTKPRHIIKIDNFLNSIGLEHEIFIQEPILGSFNLGVSYCYPKKITEPLLSKPEKGFINYHPAPLPRYKGGKENNAPYNNEYERAMANKETDWGVSVHMMDENYDTGPLLKVKKIQLHEPPRAFEELGAVSHYFLFELFKETILDFYNFLPNNSNEVCLR